MPSSRLLLKLGNFRRRARFEKLWFLPACLMLGVARSAILCLAFRRIVPWLGEPVGVCAWVPMLDRNQMGRARQIGQTVHVAARHTPWQSNCFPQAVVSCLLLRIYRVPYAVFFGLAKGGDPATMEAHAWVAAGPVRVCGGDGFARFAVVGCFVGQIAARAQPGFSGL